jgi:hypothetical protein
VLCRHFLCEHGDAHLVLRLVPLVPILRRGVRWGGSFCGSRVSSWRGTGVLQGAVMAL